LTAHHLGRQGRQSIVSTFGPVGVDHNVAPFDIAGLGKTLAEDRDDLDTGMLRSCTEISDHCDRCWLLRARRNRPRCRAAE
jgi:hypothetical protein